MATPVFCCGFECGVSAATAHWLASSGSSTFATAIKRNGARAIRINFTGGTTSWFEHTTASSNIFVMRFYMYFTTLPTVNSVHARVDGSNLGLGFKASDNSLYGVNFATAASFVYGATGFEITTDRWYTIDMKINSSANPHTVDISVDGIALGQATWANAALNSTVIALGISSVQTGSGTTNIDNYFDDFLLSNTVGDYPLGKGYVHHFIPTSDGTHNVAGTNDFERSTTGTDILNATTDAFQLVDDVPLKSGSATEFINLIAPVNATDYVECVFGPASGVITPIVAPRAVQAIVAHSASATGTNNIRLALNDNGTTNDICNGSFHASSITISYHTKQYTAGPAAAWTVVSGAGNFNNVRIRCLTNDPAPDAYFVSAMIEAEFPEPKQKVVLLNQSVKRGSFY